MLVGVPSSGLHTNGYSLARRIVFDHLGLSVDSHVPELGRTVGDALLEPHRSYLPLCGRCSTAAASRGWRTSPAAASPTTCRAFLPHGTAAVVDAVAWAVPPLFSWLQQNGDVPIDDMMRTFNMGIGLIIVTARDQAEPLIEELAARGGRDARVIGEIVPGEPPSVSYVNLS